jgi:hypothetical protein
MGNSIRNLAVLIVLAALVWSVVPRVRKALQQGTDAMTGRTAIDIGKDMQRSVVESRLEYAFGQYHALEGREAASLDDLVTAGLLPSADVRDEWRRAVLVESRGDQLVVRGLGADGTRGTDDDWLLVR